MSIYEYNEEKVMQALREEAIEEGVERGIQRGIEQGRAEERKVREEAEKLFSRQNALIKILAKSGRTQDIVRVTEDKKYREQLFEEHGI